MCSEASSLERDFWTCDGSHIYTDSSYASSMTQARVKIVRKCGSPATLTLLVNPFLCFHHTLLATGNVLEWYSTNGVYQQCPLWCA
jgi:hypothetical protein